MMLTCHGIRFCMPSITCKLSVSKYAGGMYMDILPPTSDIKSLYVTTVTPLWNQNTHMVLDSASENRKCFQYTHCDLITVNDQSPVINRIGE